MVKHGLILALYTGSLSSARSDPWAPKVAQHLSRKQGEHTHSAARNGIPMILGRKVVQKLCRVSSIPSSSHPTLQWLNLRHPKEPPVRGKSPQFAGPLASPWKATGSWEAERQDSHQVGARPDPVCHRPYHMQCQVWGMTQKKKTGSSSCLLGPIQAREVTCDDPNLPILPSEKGFSEGQLCAQPPSPLLPPSPRNKDPGQLAH